MWGEVWVGGPWQVSTRQHSSPLTDVGKWTVVVKAGRTWSGRADGCVN